MFNADAINGRPVVLVEGEFDALAIREATDEVSAVATGSTSWARQPRWRALLRTVPIVLVCFDDEDPGEAAAQYWTDALPNAVRWRPHMHDTAEMLEEGCDLARWIDEGLDHAASVTADGPAERRVAPGLAQPTPRPQRDEDPQEPAPQNDRAPDPGFDPGDAVGTPDGPGVVKGIRRSGKVVVALDDRPAYDTSSYAPTDVYLADDLKPTPQPPNAAIA